MDPFVRQAGKIALLVEDNIDTDRIMPARFLTRIERSGYGELLFCDVRSSDFVLDQPAAQGASILVVGTNFGCGSSREHAVWGLQQAGFKAIIAKSNLDVPGFSDIFRQNSANCGLLLIELDPASHSLITDLGNGAAIEIDLVNQTIHAAEKDISFEMNPSTKQALVEGKDLIGTTLALDSIISDYEENQKVYVPRESFA